MNDLEMISAVAAGLKPTVDLAKSVLDLAGSGKSRDQALELYGQIVAAHKSALVANVAQAALIKEKEALETELAKFEEWDRTKARYELKQIGRTGTFVYVVKEAERGAEPLHTICPNCFEDRRRSILQSSGIVHATGHERLLCLACDKAITVRHGDGGNGPWAAPSWKTA